MIGTKFKSVTAICHQYHCRPLIAVTIIYDLDWDYRPIFDRYERIQCKTKKIKCNISAAIRWTTEIFIIFFFDEPYI